MLLKEKKQIYDLFKTLTNVLKISLKLSDKINPIIDCIEAIEEILGVLYKEENIPQTLIKQLEKVQNDLEFLLKNESIINKQKIKKIVRQIELAQNIFREEIKAKLNIVFLPYKVSMWDSLESIYKAALEDEDCTAKVVPIPYYELTQDKKIHKYEGDKFPKDIPIVHYSDYNLEKEKPDIIFVHNIYDQYNTITQVFEEYFTTNLKKHTDMLVYVPYHISSFIDTGSSKYLAYNIPSIHNVDKVILAGEHVKKAAIRDGISEEKLLVLGSPKFDRIINAMKKELKTPTRWHEKIKDKFVFMLNTGCLFFNQDPLYKIRLLSDILNIPNFIENSVLIWRPHPLTRVAIKKYRPYLLEYYDTLTKEYIEKGFLYNNVILDETEDYIPSLVSADVLISSDSSLLRSYLVTGKSILYIHRDVPKNSSFLSENIIPSEDFYYFYDDKNPWNEIVKKLALGEDPLKEKRISLVEEFYVNIDGSCGEKVYQAIKKESGAIW